MTSPSSLLKKGLILSSLMMVTVGSIVPSIVSAADGTFGTYFQRMMGTNLGATPCPIGSVLRPFSSGTTNFGTRDCVPLSTLLGNTYGYTAPAGQAVVGFSNTGVLQFGAVGMEAPVGSIMAFDLTTCPVGWLPADGVSATPDLRGEFIRGWYSGMTGRQVSPTNTTTSSAVGSWQADMFRSHSHNIPLNYTDWDSSGRVGGGRPGTWGSATTNATGGTETRPRNIALLYCKKVASTVSPTSTGVTWTNLTGLSTGDITLATTGRVGIGTVSPTAKLDVVGITGNQSTLRVTASDGTTVATGWPAGWSGIQTWDLLAMSAKFNSAIGIGKAPSAAVDAIGEVRASSGILANVIAIGNTSNIHGAQAYPYESIQLPSWANLRFNFGANERAILWGNGILEVKGGIRFPDNTLQTTAAGGGGASLDYSTTFTQPHGIDPMSMTGNSNCPPGYVVTGIVSSSMGFTDTYSLRCTRLN